MEIKQQKLIADEILSKLVFIDPYSILAGGAPRDWRLNILANDLDFYFTSTGLTYGVVSDQLCSSFPELKIIEDTEFQDNQNPMYKHMKFLHRIFTGVYKEQKVQFIQLKDPGDTFKVVSAMSVSICKAWYKAGKIHLTDDFKLTYQTNIMFLSDGYSWQDPHPRKIKKRFSDLSCGTKEQCINKIVRKTLNQVSEEVD